MYRLGHESDFIDSDDNSEMGYGRGSATKDKRRRRLTINN